MTGNQEFEYRIKRGLSHKAAEVKPSEELLDRIIEGIQNGNRSNKCKIEYINLGFSIRIPFTAIACLFLLVAGILFTVSEGAKDVAAEAINRLRTVYFVVGEEGIQFRSVEKPADKFLVTAGGFKISLLDGEELLKKKGLKISFPYILYGNFKREFMEEGIILKKQIEYKASIKLGSKIMAAINDDKDFESLSEYNPVRNVAGLYNNSNGTRIMIIADNSRFEDNISESLHYQKVKLGSTEGYWVEYLSSNNPVVIHGEEEEFDMTKDKEGISAGCELYWFKDRVCYRILGLNGESLSMEEVIKIAESFIEGQGQPLKNTNINRD